jgi:hypothetical protein
LSYFLLFKDEASSNQLSISVSKPTPDLVNLQAEHSPVAVSQPASNQVLIQDQISHRVVVVPEGAQPMEAMILKFMAERQRAAKEAVDLNPFGSTYGVK